MPPAYDAADFPPFAVTVDLVVLTVRDDALQALLVTRGEEPFAARKALPGGFVRPDEDLPRAASRELTEETGVRRIPAHLEQLATYGAPDRDPRMRVVSVAYLVLAPRLPDPRAGGAAAAAARVPVSQALPEDLAVGRDERGPERELPADPVDGFLRVPARGEDRLDVRTDPLEQREGGLLRPARDRPLQDPSEDGARHEASDAPEEQGEGAPPGEGRGAVEGAGRFGRRHESPGS